MKYFVQLLVVIILSYSFIFSQEKQMKENPYPKFIPYVVNQNSSQGLSIKIDNKDLGKEQPARWLSIDPMADKYPEWSPYNYTLNNPLVYVDPNGMWTATYDEDGNVVSAEYEKGDTYEGLYTQLGISAEDFSDKYGIDLSQGITTKTFNITNYVLTNTDFSAGSVGNANCASFVLNATGMEIPQAMSVNFGGEVINFPAEESAVIDENFGNTLQSKYGYGNTDNPHTGDVAVFSGNYKNNPQNSIHTGIFVLNNQAGNPQYISRNGQGAPVSISTLRDYRNLYLSATPSVQIKSINYYTK